MSIFSTLGVTKKIVLLEIISKYLVNSPFSTCLWLNPNAAHSPHVNIHETGFDDKLVTKRK